MSGQSGANDFKVVLDGESARLEAAFARAEQKAGKFADGVQQKLDKVDNSIAGLAKRMSTMVKGLGITAAVGAGIAAYKSLEKAGIEAVETFAKLARDARSVGLSTDMFQALEFGAVQAGAKMESLSAGLLQYTRVVGEAKIGQGALFGALKDTNPALLEQLIRSRSQTEALRIMADALKNAESAQSRLALANQAFGGQAADMIRILGGGASALDDISARAREFGFIVDEHLIKNAEEMEQRYKLMSAVLDRNLKAVLVELGPILVDTSEAAIRLAGSINQIVDAFRALDQKTTTGLLERRRQLQMDIAQAKSYAKNQNQTARAIFDAMGFEGTRDVSDQIAELARIDKMLRERANRSSDAGLGPSGGDLGIGKLEEARAAAAKDNPWSASIDLDQRYEQSADKLADLHKRMLQETKQTRALIEAEHAEELASFDEMLADKLITQEQHEQARQDLAAITAARMAEIAREEMRLIEDMAQIVSGAVGNAFDEFVRGGEMSAESFKEILHSLLADMARLALQRAVLEPLFGGGSTPGAGLFGQLFSGFQGGFAKGGDFVSGKPMLVGEEGPELLIPKQAGTIIPNGASGGNVTVVTHIDARGAYPESIDEIKRAIARRDAELPSRIVSVVRDGKQRRVV